MFVLSQSSGRLYRGVGFFYVYEIFTKEATTMSLQTKISPEANTVLSRFNPKQLKQASLETQTFLPDLAQTQKHFVPLTIEYWSPSEVGEEKLVYVHSIGSHEVPDLETGKIKTLECVMLLEQRNGTVSRYINASRVLVGNIRDAIQRGEIVPNTTLTPLSISYLGSFKNRSNSFNSSRWQISPLVPMTQEAS